MTLLARVCALAFCAALATACDTATPTADPTPTLTETGSPSPTPAEPERRYVEVVASSCLNIREQPSIDAPVTACAQPGTILELAGPSRRADGFRWRRVRGAFSGWAAAQYLQRTDEEP